MIQFLSFLLSLLFLSLWAHEFQNVTHSDELIHASKSTKYGVLKPIASFPVAPYNSSAAVCAVGLLRTFSDHEVVSSLAGFARAIAISTSPHSLRRRHPLSLRADVFVIVDDKSVEAANQFELEMALEILRPHLFLSVSNGSLSTCGKLCMGQWEKFSLCHQVILDAEHVSGRKFEWVIKTRTDAVIHYNEGKLLELILKARAEEEQRHAEVVWLHPWAGCEDFLVLIPRRKLDVVAFFSSWLGGRCLEMASSNCNPSLRAYAAHSSRVLTSVHNFDLRTIDQRAVWVSPKRGPVASLTSTEALMRFALRA